LIQLGFNPTLVRLRPITRIMPTTSNCPFNPTLVRLRRARSGASRAVRSSFQSHAGSIEAVAT